MLFVYAAILNLVTRLYSFTFVTIFTLAGIFIDRYSAAYTAIVIASPILTHWVYTGIAAILVTIAVRKHNGLWTTVQAGTEEAGTEGERQPLLAEERSSAVVDEQLPGESSSAVPN